MAIVQNIDLNLIPDSEAVVVKVNQYDDGTGRIQAHLYLYDTAYTPASGATVRIEGTKPDKHGFSYTASISGNTVTANLTTQMTAVAGRTRVQIIVEEPSGKTGTFVFWLDVQESALASDTDISDTEIPAVVDAARQNAAIASAAAKAASDSAEAAATSAQGTEDYAEDAEAYAVGKRDGTDVPSTDPAYHNNSKYYSEQASASAQNAEASATAAAAWSEHPPYIGANGNWYIYNTTTHAFVDSGIDASITVDIADITMLASDATPYVTNTGSSTDPIFHLFIPRGYTGAAGTDGTDGNDGVGIASIVKTGSQTVSGRVVDTYTITFTDNTTTTYQVVNGKDGADGQGSGDMRKEVYDTDNDGVVDAAESVPWSGVTNVPDNFTVSELTVGTRNTSLTTVGTNSSAQGSGCAATSTNSHAEGESTRASGYDSHAEGKNTVANAANSHAEGFGTVAGYQNQHVSGKYNDNKSDNAFEIGNGVSGATSNALEVTWTGDLLVAGEITDGDGNVLSKVDNRLATMPTAGADYVGKIVQFVGTTTGSYTNGYFYKCVENSGSYSWVRTDVQPSSGGNYTEKMVSGTVTDDTLAFTDNAITATCIIDGPYIEDALIGIDSVTQSGTTVTYTLEDDSADTASAYIWVRTLNV